MQINKYRNHIKKFEEIIEKINKQVSSVIYYSVMLYTRVHEQGETVESSEVIESNKNRR